MTPHRYVAAHAAEALARIRAELGEDAVVLGSRPVQGGVEFLASAYTDLAVETPARPAAWRAGVQPMETPRPGAGAPRRNAVAGRLQSAVGPRPGGP